MSAAQASAPPSDAAPVPASTVTLECFTDEEMAVLAGPESIAVSPFLAVVGDAERTTTLRTAYRCLLARGILDPLTRDAAQTAVAEGAGLEIELAVREDIHALVMLRRSALAVVAVSRTTATGADFWYAHVHPEVSLGEAVSADGLHRFTLIRTEDLVAAVLEACLHPDAADHPSGRPAPPFTVDPSAGTDLPQALVEALGEGLVRAELVVRSVGDARPAMWGVSSSAAGCWLACSHLGSTAPVLVHPHSVREIRESLGGAIDAATARVRDAAGRPTVGAAEPA